VKLGQIISLIKNTLTILLKKNFYRTRIKNSLITSYIVKQAVSHFYVATLID
jgi:hypothetical protein